VPKVPARNLGIKRVSHRLSMVGVNIDKRGRAAVDTLRCIGPTAPMAIRRKYSVDASGDLRVVDWPKDQVKEQDISCEYQNFPRHGKFGRTSAAIDVQLDDDGELIPNLVCNGPLPQSFQDLSNLVTIYSFDESQDAQNPRKLR